MALYTTQTNPWKKRFLLPAWIIRSIFTLAMVASYALMLTVLVRDPDDMFSDEFDSSTINAAKAIIAVFMACFAISLLLDVYCMIQYMRRSLRPLAFLIVNVIQTLFWAVLLILQLIGTAAAGSAHITFFAIACFILYVSVLVYSASVYHRERKSGNRGAYAPTANPNHGNNLSAQEFGQANYGQPTYGGLPPYSGPNGDEYAQELKPVPQGTEYHAPGTAPSQQQQQQYA